MLPNETTYTNQMAYKSVCDRQQLPKPIPYNFRYKQQKR